MVVVVIVVVRSGGIVDDKVDVLEVAVAALVIEAVVVAVVAVRALDDAERCCVGESECFVDDLFD